MTPAANHLSAAEYDLLDLPVPRYAIADAVVVIDGEAVDLNEVASPLAAEEIATRRSRVIDVIDKVATDARLTTAQALKAVDAASRAFAEALPRHAGQPAQDVTQLVSAVQARMHEELLAFAEALREEMAANLIRTQEAFKREMLAERRELIAALDKPKGGSKPRKPRTAKATAAKKPAKTSPASGRKPSTAKATRTTATNAKNAGASRSSASRSSGSRTKSSGQSSSRRSEASRRSSSRS